MSISKRIIDWLEQRVGFCSVLSRLIEGTVDPRWAWLRTTGMVCLALVLVECITGPILGTYYAPSAQTAYKDILAIEQNPMGRFLRGLHHWSSAALILLSLFTVARMFFRAEYKGRRDIVWLATVLFFQFVLLFQLSGHVLPWDTNAVATTSVEAGIASNFWVVGPTVKRLTLGAGTTGGITLTRAYGLHALILPLVTLLLVAVPLLLHRLRQPDAPDDVEAQSRNREPYYPHHMAREMLAALAVFLVIAGLAWFGKTPLDKEATAANLAEYHALSEWYVLPMHAATMIPPFNKPLFEPLVTLVGPGLLFGALLVLPFVDRNPERRAAKRKLAVLCGSATIAATFALYLFAVVVEKPLAAVEKVAVGRTRGARVIVDLKLAETGKGLYGKQGCNSCHAISGAGGKAGPDLTHAGTLRPDRDWQIRHLVKPDSMVPGSTMPAYAQLKPDELKALAEYLISLR